MSNELTRSSPPSVCPKCSVTLKPDIYFCSNCTEAWRNPSQGLETTPEPVWDAETRIRLRAAGAYEACFLYLFASFFGLIVHKLLGSQNSYDPLETILVSVSMGIASLWIIYRNFDIIKNSIRFDGLISRWFLLSAVVLVPMLAVNYFYHSFLLKETSVMMDSSAYLLADESSWLAIIFICVFPAVFEELVFRSYVYPLLNRALTLVWAAVISSVLFASLHFSFWSWPYHFLLGLLLAFTASKCRSVLPCIILHFVHNYVVLFLLPRS